MGTGGANTAVCFSGVQRIHCCNNQRPPSSARGCSLRAQHGAQRDTCANWRSDGVAWKSRLGYIKNSSSHDCRTPADVPNTAVSMEQIHLFDVATVASQSSLSNGAANTGWSSQFATGTLPAPRVDFCLVLASASDNSSANIYMYGGKLTQ